MILFPEPKNKKTIFEMRILDQIPRRQRRILFDANAYISEAKNCRQSLFFSRFFSEKKIKKSYSSSFFLSAFETYSVFMFHMCTYVRSLCTVPCIIRMSRPEIVSIFVSLEGERNEPTKYKTEIKCANASFHRVQCSSSSALAFVNVCTILFSIVYEKDNSSRFSKFSNACIYSYAVNFMRVKKQFYYYKYCVCVCVCSIQC